MELARAELGHLAKEPHSPLFGGFPFQPFLESEMPSGPEETEVISVQNVT